MLAAGAGWKLFDFFGAFCKFNGVLPGNETVELLFFFWHYSVTNNVSFTNIICLNMPPSIKCIFSRIFIPSHNKVVEGI